jgi:hypothetical protein
MQTIKMHCRVCGDEHVVCREDADPWEARAVEVICPNCQPETAVVLRYLDGNGHPIEKAA